MRLLLKDSLGVVGNIFPNRILKIGVVGVGFVLVLGVGWAFPLHAAQPVQALPGYSFAFPQDHGAHNQFLLEWWYFTGHVFTKPGRRFGYELTFFRKAVQDSRVEANSSQWAIHHLYLAHFALTDVESGHFRFEEKLSRAGMGKAGAETGRMHVWVDQWAVLPLDSGHQRLRLQASAQHMKIDLLLSGKKSPVIHGKDGISRKGENPGQASHYYSLTRLETHGTLEMAEESWEVSGLSWMDHEFGSGDLGAQQVGWDWFSLQLEQNTEIMVYLLRLKNGTVDPASSGSIILGDGTSRHLIRDDIILNVTSTWESPHTHARYPASWNLKIPSMDMALNIQPVMADQELRTTKSTQVTYWEGAVDVNGLHKGKTIRGLGYVELTGYAKPLVFGEK